MAKLSKGNLEANKVPQISKVDNWNPPPISSSTAAQMLPPKSRPLPRLPTTPSHNSHTNSVNSERQDSSSKKSRRRRGGKRHGDASSEITTTVSGDTARSVTTPTANGSEILVPASQSNLSSLPPNASAEEIRVFENEPEMYGVYASSEEGDEDKGEEKQFTAPLSQQQRAQTYSPSVATRIANSSPITNSPSGAERLQAQPAKPQIGSDSNPSGSQIPPPKKIANGRFECPFKAAQNCAQTFADSKGAKRHAKAHLDADQFSCDNCGKTYTRRDTFSRHVKTHEKDNGVIKKTGKGQAARSSSVVGEKKASKGKINVTPASSSSSDEHQDATMAPGDVRDSAEDDNPIDRNDSGQQETQRKVNASAHRSIQQTDGHDKEIEEGSSTEASVVDNILTNSTPRIRTSSLGAVVFAVEESQLSTVNGALKRKRRSALPSADSEKSASRKRARKDDDTQRPLNSNRLNTSTGKKLLSSAAHTTEFVTDKVLEDRDIEMDDQDDEEQAEQAQTKVITDFIPDPTAGVDVEMTEEELVEETDNEDETSSSADESTHVPLPSSQNVSAMDAVNGAADRSDHSDSDHLNSKSRKSEPVEETEDESPAESDAELDTGTGPPESPTQPSKESATVVHRQSSINSFVQRSKSTTPAIGASASGSRVSIDIPVRSKTQSKKSQGKLSSKNQARVSKPINDTLDSEEDSSIRELKSGSDPEKVLKAPATRKGKARARAAAEEPVISETEEQTSSDDRPKATTVARRTSSVGSRNTPMLRNRTVSKRREKVASDGDESERSEGVKSKPKSRSSAKRPAKPSAKAESDGRKVKRKRAVSTAGSTWAEASTTGQTGRFTDDEAHILNSWRDSFCREHNMSAYEFNEMMMNTATVNKLDWRYGWITKADFMQQYYEQLPERNRRSMMRYRERTFQNVETAPWTEADDKELRQLVTERGTKWVEIAQIMGRTQDAVNQRWRHKLNYGEKPALMGDWTTEEIKTLEDEVTAYARLKHTTPDDEELQVPWNAISKKMGSGRTAQQCSNRWRINTSKRVNGKFVKVPHNDRLPGTKADKPRTPSKMEKRLSGQGTKRSEKEYKSTERVEDSDDEEQEGEGEGDADNESQNAQNAQNDNENSEAKDEGGDSSDDEDSSQAGSDGNDQEPEVQQSEESSASDSEAAETGSESPQRKSSSKAKLDESATEATQSLNASVPKKSLSQKRSRDSSQNFASSQPTPKNTPGVSQSQPSSSTQPQAQSSSQLPTFKTPAVSKNPLRRVNRSQRSPSLDLSLSQLHAGTQANSSAKRTTGRTNRTRVPDSAITERRPSPELSVRRRPLRSSSPLLSPLLDTLRGKVTEDDDDDDDDEEEESSTDEADTQPRSQKLELDFKSPTSFVSARDTAEPSSTDDKEEDSSSDDSSNSDSDADSDSDAIPAQPAQPSESNFWQSASQRFKSITGIGQREGNGRVDAQTRKVPSLAEVLRRGRVEESASDDSE